jgi:hypothetical protein
MREQEATNLLGKNIIGIEVLHAGETPTTLFLVPPLFPV